MGRDRDDNLNVLRELKRRLRAQASANRQGLENKEELSRQICEKVVELDEYAGSQTILTYVAGPSEVQTEPLLASSWHRQKRVVVPSCHGNQLQLFRIESMDELAPRTLGLLEPQSEIRRDRNRHVLPEELDLIVVPGVAFDRNGGRVGHGKGFYDRLLPHARPDILLLGLAFECQLFPKVPMRAHDVYLHKVVTERAVYQRGVQ